MPATILPISGARQGTYVVLEAVLPDIPPRNIGVHEMTLGKWVKKARESDGSAGKPLEDSERAELERLRAENAELKMQVEFAKKVATWFAKDKQ